MYVFVHVCMYTHVHVHTCVLVYPYVCTHMCVHAYIGVCVCVCGYICLSVHTHVLIHYVCMHTHMCTHTYMDVDTCQQIYIYTHIYIYIYTCVCVCVCVCACMWVHACECNDLKWCVLHDACKLSQWHHSEWHQCRHTVAGMSPTDCNCFANPSQGIVQCSAVLCYAMLLGWVGLDHESFGSWVIWVMGCE